MNKIAIYLMIRCLFIIAISLWFVIHLFSGKKFISPRVDSGKGLKKIFQTYGKPINISIALIISVWLMFAYVEWVIPTIRDIPNMIHGNYNYAQGTVVGWHYSYEERILVRSIRIDDEITRRVSLLYI